MTVTFSATHGLVSSFSSRCVRMHFTVRSVYDKPRCHVFRLIAQINKFRNLFYFPVPWSSHKVNWHGILNFCKILNLLCKKTRTLILNGAIQDILLSLQQYRVWLHLGWLEVKQRYRRSMLGPWWISISMLIFIAAMSKIFSHLFHQNVAEYVPFFTAGFMFWSFISTSIMESTEIFRANSSFIKQISLPYTTYILKFLVKNVIVLAHNFIIYFLVLAAFKLNPGWRFLAVFPGALLLIINLYWMSLLIALLSTRFRDITPIVTSCMQILFFITPISWTPKLLGTESLIVQLNPFVYLLDLVRNPLLGHEILFNSWCICLSIAGIGFLASLTLFNCVRTRIPFWLD